MKLQPGLDRTRARAFVYHATDPEQDKQVYSEEAAKYFADGWFDTPAKRGQEVIPEVKEVEEAKEVELIGIVIPEEEPFEPPKKKAGRPKRFKK